MCPRCGRLYVYVCVRVCVFVCILCAYICVPVAVASKSQHTKGRLALKIRESSVRERTAFHRVHLPDPYHTPPNAILSKKRRCEFASLFKQKVRGANHSLCQGDTLDIITKHACSDTPAPIIASVLAPVLAPVLRVLPPSLVPSSYPCSCSSCSAPLPQLKLLLQFLVVTRPQFLPRLLLQFLLQFFVLKPLGQPRFSLQLPLQCLI